MSLRPAQALVAESSRFNLRTLFESKEISAPVDMPSTLPALPALAQPKPKDAKFTFNGLVMTNGPAGEESKGVKLINEIKGANDTENLRLKAQAYALNEKVTQLTAHLAATSESVMRGNKALVAERAQFHAQYAAVNEKLKEASVAAPLQNEKLLTAKVLALQTENDRLAANTDDAYKKVQDSNARYTTLTAKHSVLLGKYTALETEHAQMQADHAQQLAAAHMDAARADSLVEALDAKLAHERASATNASLADAPVVSTSDALTDAPVVSTSDALTDAPSIDAVVADTNAPVATVTTGRGSTSCNGTRAD